MIASADGIDYMESSSAQGVSTITVHLKLNYDTNAALTQIQAKVAQVRNDLPPEAEAPVIEVESKDSEFAAVYLSFYSKDLDQNQITDYLTRVVQPKLSAIPGVQKANILGRAHLCHAHLAEAGQARRPQYHRYADPAGSPGQQLPVRRRQDQGQHDRGQSHRKYRSPVGGEFRNLVIARKAVRSSDSVTWPT